MFNGGDVQTGMKITMICNGSVKNPRIFNRVTRQMLGVKYEFVRGDELIFTTHNGKIEEKRGICTLKPQEEFSYDYLVTFYE